MGIELTNGKDTLDEFFNFDIMITPKILKASYSVITIILFFAGIIALGMRIYNGTPGMGVLVMLGMWALIFIIRLVFEGIILFFKIYERL